MRVSRRPIHDLDQLIQKLEEIGYTCPTLIQSKSVPTAKNGYPRKQVITLEFKIEDSK